jgi:D-serine deaminase-like pyridoxal phosphate-dependent protein
MSVAELLSAGGDSAYRSQIGRARHEVTTPALLVDLDVARRNIESMAAAFRELPAQLRPHVKAHRSPHLARLQIQAGAVGVATATVSEAVVMAEAGVGDVLIANQVVQPWHLQTISRLAHAHRITVVVDDVRNVRTLAAAAGTAGSRLEVLVELDVGMGRCGVRTKEEALPLVEAIRGEAALRFRGMQGYEGHCMLEPDPAVRARECRAANARLIEAVDFLAGHGHASEAVSAGGTGTYSITGANPRITEVQAGSYALMDAFHGGLVPGAFEVAMTVLGTVVSRHGTTIVLDCGRKSVGVDFVMPQLLRFPEGEVRSCAEEHCLVEFDGIPPLDLGDRAELIAGYGPTTVNLHGVFHIVEEDVVTDIWPIAPRGPRPTRPGGTR